MAALEDLPADIPVAEACRALGASRATLYRQTSPPTPPIPRCFSQPPRTLSPDEVATLHRFLHEERFVDQPPAEIFAQLLSEGTYVAAIRTMYRYLGRWGEVHERRNQRSGGPHAMPSLTASAPNQIWTWDITKLAGPQPGVFFYAYVMIDLFSRYVVGWMVAERENGDLASAFLKQTPCVREVVASSGSIRRGFLSSCGAPGVLSLAYSDSFKRKLVQRMLPPSSLSATELSNEVHVPQNTLSRWLREASTLGFVPPEQPPSSPPFPPPVQARSAREKLRLLLSFEALSDAERGAWLRREGLHDAELQVWRQELEDALDDSKPEVAKSVHPNKRIRQLEREVQRKDKALAEAAALLLLQKKVRAFWEAEDDDTQEKNGP